ncbi:hypothetical protein EIP86_010918 [Pleurotus ostreatoroseus]|nr:hypothetical protein EIP86_010918 [Pleurotus ostreatoroseus]
MPAKRKKADVPRERESSADSADDEETMFYVEVIKKARINENADWESSENLVGQCTRLMTSFWAEVGLDDENYYVGYEVAPSQAWIKKEQKYFWSKFGSKSSKNERKRGTGTRRATQARVTKKNLTSSEESTSGEIEYRTPRTTGSRRHRDLWMSFIAREIVGDDPNCYPDLGDSAENIHGDLQSSIKSGVSSPVDSQLLRETTEANQRRFNKLLQPILAESNKGAQTVSCILKLCDGTTEQSTYDLVLYAVSALRNAHDDDGERIAEDMCNKMLEILDSLAEKQQQASELKKYRTSLRRVLLRFCKDADYLPRSLFLQDMPSFTNAEQVPGGGYADVYRLESPPGQVKALKCLRLFMERSVVMRFLFEAVLWSRLRHPNLLPFLGLYNGVHNNTEKLFMVSSWMPNGELTKCIADLEMRKQPVPRLRWIHEVSSGLRYLHDECIVHGDLHARNLLIDENYQIRIADFGLSRLDEQSNTAPFTSEGNHGLIWWMAPELMVVGARTAYATDRASLCDIIAVFRQIWTGEGPFKKCKTSFQVHSALSVATNTPENERRMDTFHEDEPYAKSLREVALRCWSRKSEERPTMRDLESALTKIYKPRIAL